MRFLRRIITIGSLWAMTAISLAACDAITDVDAPDVIDPESLDSPEGALALRAGALRTFNEIFGGWLGMVGSSGLVSDELISSETTLRSDTDARRDEGQTISATAWGGVSVARRSLLEAIPFMLRHQPDQSAWTGQLYALLGLAETLIGENFCSGAPLSQVVDGKPVFGASRTTADIFSEALARFDSVVALSVDSARLRNLALVGRARTLLDLGRFDEAAAAAAGVPTSFVYHAEFASGAQQNGTFDDPTLDYGVADRQGANGLDFVTAADPRIPVVFSNVGDDGVTAMYRFGPYATTSAPIVVASGREARLIEAEAALRRGDVSAWLTSLNDLRAEFEPPLAPLDDPGTPDARVSLMFRERAFWLFLTAHRLGDLRRLVSQYGREPDSVFPAGVYKDGLPYGRATYVALPESEDFNRNPDFAGCDTAAP